MKLPNYKFKRTYLALLFLFLNSCAGMCMVNEVDTKEATIMYNTIGTYMIRMPEEHARRLFGDCYNPSTDRIFVYSSFFSKRYILEKYGKPWTYAGDRW
jgi:hypothetical protein